MPRSKFSAILHEKCPRCREGNLFVYPLSNVSRFATTHENCPVCGLRFEKEPGTFYGAMYVSYGFNVAMVITLFIATFVLGNDPHLMWYFIVIIPSLLLAAPVFFRYSRILWLYLFSDAKYDPRYADKIQGTAK